ncbi:unnamed protein product [Allacma fusca]|uniref:RING-type domain-containing protein n=1 Tax=Allacma fusca TaxID=39272 RepID=A0A8J2NWR8_9HEXA|nr:unnamed protein product [Allacma fusca]
MSYCEIICDQCKLSLALPGPFARAIHDDIYITACRHLFHFGCLYRLYIHSTMRTEQGAPCVPCPHPSCNQLILGSDSFFVDQSLRIFEVLNTDSRVQSLVNQLALQRDYVTRIEMVLVNDNITLTSQVEDYRKEYAKLTTQYNRLLDHQIGNLFANLRPRMNSSTESQPSSSQMEPVLPQPSISNSGSPSPSWRRVQQSSRSAFAKPQNLSCGSAPVQRPEPVETPIPTIINPQNQNIQNNPVTQPIISQLDCINMNEPIPSTSSDSSRAPDSEVGNISDHVAATRLRSKIPPPKPKKGTSADKNLFRKNYKARFGSDSAELKPFYPINSYPHGFTAAGYEILEDTYNVAFFAYNILIMGDGHANGIAKYLGVSKPYENLIDNKMYRRDMLASGLLSYLGTFKELPKRIMISIGNFDVERNTSYEHFFYAFQAICLLLKKLQVQQLIILPLIPHEDINQTTFSEINRALNFDWERTLGGRVFHTSDIFEELHRNRAGMDQKGPFYPSNLYANIIPTMRDKFIPEVLRKQTIILNPRPPTPDVDISSEYTPQLLPLDLKIPRICLTPVRIAPRSTTNPSTPSTSSHPNTTKAVAVQSTQTSSDENSNLGKMGKLRRLERRKNDDNDSSVRHVRRRTDRIVRMVEAAIEQAERVSLPSINLSRERATLLYSDSRYSNNDQRVPSQDEEISDTEADE